MPKKTAGNNTENQTERLEGLRAAVWRLIAFCVVGWTMFWTGWLCFGPGMVRTLMMLAGVFIVAYPSLNRFWKHGFTALFAGLSVLQPPATTDADGKKTAEINAGLGVAIYTLKFVVAVCVVAIGTFLTFVRAVFLAGKFVRIQKDGKMNIPLKQSALFPCLVGVGLIIGVPVLLNIIAKIFSLG
ncbi:MAG: hypothetical protein FWF01_04285 [Alphaproteobacteria bacterium]|nr:hypothetical protein [Alphaproteobacteria bacterium]